MWDIEIWVLKYDTNSYANRSTICKYLGNTVSRNILQYHAITGCFSTESEKLAPSKKSLKNQAV